ncbi:unnamed protein product [Bemisia tabaci]|uniref:Geranylgeranyl transferase type-1 subunit beta n=1 Tax=Bemisia tabaci TaxID=7038 RepID=A0A9P0F2E7_BEMTA|nr:PREDICTED: geranylgeranyl transferase type-1 subunit beta [Bemisia tabaci]CAH0385452.1 unnamed protein product [Bemisia tabaci]
MSIVGRDLTFKAEKHIRYLLRFLEVWPHHLEQQDSLRLTVVYFAVSGLDMLNALDQIDAARKKEIIDWVYALQVEPSMNDGDINLCGFQNAPTLNIQDTDAQNAGPLLKKYRCANVAMDYSALAILVILGDDLSRVNKKAVLEGVKAMQQDNGCFASCAVEGECDMRFVFCAVAVCYILNDWSVINVEKIVNYIRDSLSYEYGIGQGPGQEAHGGSTYCAVASLALLDKVHECFSPKEISMLTRWCLFRQECGFHGRPNKPDDTCYSFWVGASLKILGAFDLMNVEENRNFILSTQDLVVGGFSKWMDSGPDPLHSCLGLCSLSLMKVERLLEIHPALNVTQRAHNHLQKLHASGRS